TVNDSPSNGSRNEGPSNNEPSSQPSDGTLVAPLPPSCCAAGILETSVVMACVFILAHRLMRR
ncbi:MAG: hypothetical protein FWC56_03440, partial [Phycisphaerae bacterium]|nr:hypothetical protein [Phycisphaerae bacterium]